MSSKKAEKRKIREEKHSASQRRNAVLSLVLKIAGGIMVPLILYVLWQGLSSNAQVLPPDAISAADHVRGNPEGVTLTVYADFQCPACKVEAELIAANWRQISDRVQLVFRHYPLDTHPHAFDAALYSEAAARQGKFWEMHDQLYANQIYWSSAPSVEQIFDSYALTLGLDMQQLKADMQGQELRAKIFADQRGGTRAGVRATPSLYVNGRLVNNPRNPSELIGLINNALAQ